MQMGTWVIDAAKEWPSCEFVRSLLRTPGPQPLTHIQVGFDLVNIQIPPNVIDPSIAERIEWTHGNLLVSTLWAVRGD